MDSKLKTVIERKLKDFMEEELNIKESRKIASDLPMDDGYIQWLEEATIDELLDGMTRDKLYKFMKTKLNEKEQEWLEKYIKTQGIMPY